MPYGIDKNEGGDSKDNVRWMERCIISITKTNPSYTKQKVIAICKSQLKKNSGKVLEKNR